MSQSTENPNLGAAAKFEGNLSLDINTLNHLYSTGKLSTVELVRIIYQRIKSQSNNPIWITLLPEEEVVKAAYGLEEVRKREGLENLPLFGIPFAVKDNIDIAGLPTTAACPDFSYVSVSHATVVERLLNAGGLLIGKTNLDQFATGLVGTRSPYGVCHNSYNDEYISGGSSSGSAIAVASKLVTFSLGTDTAGSGRVPAGFNNIVGLKPSRGLLSTSGVVPACRSLDCVSVFALNSEDAMRVTRTIQGFDSFDSYSRRSLPLSPRPISKFKFGIPNSEQLAFFGDKEYEKLYQQSIGRLESMGGTAIEIDFLPFQETANLLYYGAWVAERYSGIEEFITRKPDSALPVIQQILNNVHKYSASDVFRTFHKLEELKQRTAQEWEKMDILVVPTAGTIYRIEEVEADPIQLNTNLGYYTNFVNLLDLSAIAIPSGFRSDKLPFGITLIAPALHDEILSVFGGAYNQSLN
jgi:allophanate hydrolase